MTDLVLKRHINLTKIIEESEWYQECVSYLGLLKTEQGDMAFLQLNVQFLAEKILERQGITSGEAGAGRIGLAEFYARSEMQ